MKFSCVAFLMMIAVAMLSLFPSNSVTIQGYHHRPYPCYGWRCHSPHRCYLRHCPYYNGQSPYYNDQEKLVEITIKMVKIKLFLGWHFILLLSHSYLFFTSNGNTSCILFIFQNFQIKQIRKFTCFFFSFVFFLLI